jgi:aminocarboxymuconate-semialdehyde decarboxylase
MMKDPRTPEKKKTIGRRNFLKLSAGTGAMIGAGAAAMTTLTVPQAKAATGGAPRVAGWDLKPKGANKPVGIDCHTHWAPEAYVKAMGELGRPTRNIDPLMVDLDQRRKWMDEHGLQMLCMTLSGGMPWQYTSPDVAAHLCQLINDAGIQAHTAFPDRFLLGMEVPALDPVLALKEINRIAGKPGVVAIHLPNSIEGHDYVFEPAFGPVLARLEELQYPILFHPIDGEVNYYGVPETRVGDATSKFIRFDNSLGFPFETATTAAKFIVTGTLDKYPKLQIVLPHAGGSFPYVAGRVEHGLTRRKFPLKRPFREYIRQFHYDSMTYYPRTFRFLLDLVGADRIVIGTDNSFGARQAFDYPDAMIEYMNLPQKEEDLILNGNAKRLFRL